MNREPAGTAFSQVKGESPRVPKALRIASGLLVAYGVFTFVSIMGYRLLTPDAYGSSRFLVGGFLGLGGTLWILTGANLLKLRHWALTLGRVLSVLAAVIGPIVLARNFAVVPPTVVLIQSVQTALAVAIAISLFLPAVIKAFRQPPDPTQHWITSRTSPPPP